MVMLSCCCYRCCQALESAARSEARQPNLLELAVQVR